MNLFSKAHAIAKVLEGSYSARIKLAFLLIKENRINEVNELLDVNTFLPLVNAPKLEEAPKSVKVEKVAKTEKPKKAKKEKEEKEGFKIEVVPVSNNILEVFGENVYNTVQTIVNNFLTYSRNKDKALLYIDGMESLKTVKEEKGLQCILVSYFLQDYSMVLINKMLSMGVNYKKLNNMDNTIAMEKLNWSNASSNSGKIDTYEKMDIFNILVVDSLRLNFDMLESVQNAYTSVYFRTVNTMRTALRRLKKQTKVSLPSNETLEEIQGAFKKSHFETNISLVDELTFLDEEYKELLKLTIMGYSKKDVYEVKGRIDRKFKAMEKELEEASGMTIKEAKQERKNLEEAFDNRMKALKEERKAQKEQEENIANMVQNAILFTGEYKTEFTNNINPVEKSLKAENTEMIQKLYQAKKFNSKVVL